VLSPRAAVFDSQRPVATGGGRRRGRHRI